VNAIRSEALADDAWKDPAINIMAGARILRVYYDLADTLEAALASYNAGPRALSAPNPDSLTTGGDYSRDVLARAGRFDTSGEA
jgi:soluble lytic murein transglycosylase-like protein